MQEIEDKLFDLLCKSDYMDWDRQIKYLIAHGVKGD